MNTYIGREFVQDDDSIPLLSSDTTPPSLDKENVLIRNDLSQIETLHELFKKKRRRNKSEYHDRMNRLLEFNWTYLVYLSSAVLLALIIAIIVGIIFFSESLLEYLVFVSITSAVLVILSCIWIIIANTKRKYVKKF